MSKGTEGQAKKEFPTQSAKPDAGSKAKGGASGGFAGGCVCHGCKKDSTQFGFCSEHYDHFKFGLIKKTGEQVSDYEKKYGHYQAYVAKQRARKAA